MSAPPRILAIAGSDSSGGAGIQADIKTITMLGGYAMTAITAVTSQNTMGVLDVVTIPPESVILQAEAGEDIGIDAIKIGMLGSPATARAIAWDFLPELPADVPVVFDPVMVATSGSILATDETVAVFRELMKMATVVTPNMPELEALGGLDAMLVHCPAVLVKGGHAEGDTIVDRLITRAGEIACWEDPRIDTRHTHGTGCTLSSAIATLLGKGQPLEEAIEGARAFVRAALRAAPGFGAGHGPMGHHAVR